ncbi:MAG: VWA domain-containing protein [Pyrinomonadaceae bacterium]|nr:VWA domain-containing protein [Acidobacteriota bacterium]MBK7935249.1 VWA domain-containing protein [Acidobacteriota bacterium]MBP7376468.1 VWA domain-containing protein [Pyrinomonadaceae bacterium]
MALNALVVLARPLVARAVYIAFTFAIVFATMFAQEPTPTPPLADDDNAPVKVKTDLVTLTLTVTDLYGRYVSGLNKNAFQIADNGEPQEITFFSDSDAPVSVGILFDVSGSMSGDKINKARKALSRFILTSHPSDEYFLIAFNSRAQLLLDRTRDGDAVLQKLTLVQPKNNTALYDAVYLGIERVTRGSHQKRALLIISDGQDNASRYNFGEVRRLMKEADVVTYSVGIMSRGDTMSGPGMQGQSFLDEISSVTGGKSFYPDTDVEMDEIFERIALELRHQYSIGYTPKDFAPDGKWRKVKVKVKPPRGLPRLTVRSREGYYATPNVSYR